MKYLLFTLLLTLAWAASAQKITRKKMSFDYVQYPSISVKGVSNYTSTMVIGYQDKIEAAKNQHQQDLAQVETDYQFALANLDKAKAEAEADYLKAIEKQKEAQKKADAEYEEDMKKYRKGGFLIGQDAPKRKTVSSAYKRTVSTPTRRVIAEPVYPKSVDVSSAAKQYMSLDGMTNSPDNALQIIVTLKGFEKKDPEVKSKKQTKVDRNGNARTVVTYQAIGEYKHPFHVQVISPDGKTLLDEILGGEYSKYTSAALTSASSAKSSVNNPTYIQKLESDILDANLVLLKETLNDKLGFPTKKRETLVKIFTHKKMDYTDYMTAYENVLVGYKKLSSRDTKTIALEKINKAVALWTKAMEEADAKNKKARINKKVMKATYLMLAEGAMWAEDFETAELQLTKLEILGVVGKDKKMMAALQVLLETQRQKITAYKEANQ